MIQFRRFEKGMELGDGFFEGWPHPPDKETHEKILENSALAIVAIDDETGQVIGFVNAISDGVHAAYISAFGSAAFL